MSFMTKMKENLRAKNCKRTISVVLLAPVFIAPWFLVYFKVDKTAATTSAKAIQLLEKLEVGAKCFVKEKEKTYEGIIMTYGEYFVCHSEFSPGGAYLHCTNCRLVQ